MTCRTSDVVRAVKNQRKAFGTTDRSEGSAQVREAKRQAKALASLMGATA